MRGGIIETEEGEKTHEMVSNLYKQENQERHVNSCMKD